MVSWVFWVNKPKKKEKRESDVQRDWLLYKRREGSRNYSETQGRTREIIAHFGDRDRCKERIVFGLMHTYMYV